MKKKAKTLTQRVAALESKVKVLEDSLVRVFVGKIDEDASESGEEFDAAYWPAEPVAPPTPEVDR